MEGTATTPRMRRQLRLLAVLAGFAGLVIVVAFVGAFRNTSANDAPVTESRVDIRVREGDVIEADDTADVLLAGKRYLTVHYFLVRADGVLHALWERSPHLGCTVKVADEPKLHGGEPAVFTDPCGGSSFALDGRCLDGPCPRGLDGFAIVEHDGGTYVDFTRPVPGAPRT